VDNDVVLIFRVTADRGKREEYKERACAVVARDRGFATFLEPEEFLRGHPESEVAGFLRKIVDVFVKKPGGLGRYANSDDRAG
jgi:hypothetical protein